MAHQRSPAEVKVKCFYFVHSQSPKSNTCSITVQTPPRPTLTVNPAVITETDSVTLNCQTPSSVSQCFYLTVSGGTVRTLSCLQTLTGSELLTMAHHKLPAEVEVKCFYTVRIKDLNSPSSYSDAVSIIIQSPPRPTLTVNPAVITETDSVTLNCQTPSSVSQCFYLTVSGGTMRMLSCLQTLTGSELLTMAHHKLPAEVERDRVLMQICFLELADAGTSMTAMEPTSTNKLTGLTVTVTDPEDVSDPVTGMETASSGHTNSVIKAAPPAQDVLTIQSKRSSADGTEMIEKDLTAGETSAAAGEDLTERSEASSQQVVTRGRSPVRRSSSGLMRKRQCYRSVVHHSTLASHADSSNQSFVADTDALSQNSVVNLDQDQEECLPDSSSSILTNDNDSGGSLSIPAFCKKENGSRLYNKKQYCLYCKLGVAKIARHLEQAHIDESEVAQAFAFKKGSKERRMHLELLRNGQLFTQR
ncbi:uncharacterized protein LOC110003326 isoform X5 [Xyrichtys novacula]|uniref:Uncharacterized protein LOC110003326 isoform X5 n=1 Tax=Xyrichtys novacula TaxID=13765 RepID=A0AAV1HN34_XYRNO|nr:uncharacterized protein LOC110003326 isoform X5 [Xyrichtys novacula]